MYPAETYLDMPEVLGPRLSPDGDHVAFLWNTTGRRELYVMSTDGDDDPRQLTDGDLRGWAFGTDYSWQPDGDGLYVHRFPMDDPDRASISAVTLNGEWTTLFEIDEISLHWGAVTNQSLVGPIGQETLYLYDLPADNLQPLVEESLRNFQFVCASSDGQYVAFWAVTPESESPHGAFVTRLDEANSLIQIAPDTEGTLVPVEWHPDDTWLLVHDSTEARYGAYDPKNQTVEWLVDAPETEFVLDNQDTDQPIGFMTDGDGILTLPDGNPTIVNAAKCLDVGLSSVTEADVRDQQFVFVTEGSDNRAPRLVTLAWPEGKPATILESSYRSVSPADDVPATEHSYESSTGETKVLVHRPAEVPVPAIVLTYPKQSLYEEFPRWVQYLVYRGYAIVRPSIPDTGTDAEHDNVAAVGEWLTDQEWVDGDRVAVFGHSAGGGQVLRQLFTRDIWAAGIARAAPLSSFPDDISNLRAPLRIHHPVYDTVVPIEQAREVRTSLRNAGYGEGTDFEYAELPDEWHITADIKQDANELTRIIDFLDRKL